MNRARPDQSCDHSRFNRSDWPVQSGSDNTVPEPQHNLHYEGMVLIALLLCSCLCSVNQPQWRWWAVLMVKFSLLYIDDEDRLQHVLPYAIVMLSDLAAIVQRAALETLCDILPLIQDFPPSDAKIFPEYILFMLSMLPDDPEESVWICHANNIFKTALTAYRFLIQSYSLQEAGVLDKLSPLQRSSTPTSDASKQLQAESNVAQLMQLRKSLADVIQELVMGPKQTSNIRRALRTLGACAASLVRGKATIFCYPFSLHS